MSEQDLLAGALDIGGPAHLDWLDDQLGRQISFVLQAVDPRGGFGYLGPDGRPMASHPRELYITCRMTYVFAIASRIRPDLAEDAGAAAGHGVRALRELFHDKENGGWFSAVDEDGVGVPGRKEAYGHAFVLLAAAAAGLAGIDGAAVLLADAEAVLDRHFWDEEFGLLQESFAADFTDPEAYRGANSNMHAVEAYLTAADALNDNKLRLRAERICDAMINRAARANGWSLPEHFDVDWRPTNEYNADQPAHPFRPYGSTIGHWFEWSRLLVQLQVSLGDGAPGWIPEAAAALFDHGVDDGWAADGHDGFPYTLDWDGQVVVAERMWWPLTEAICAADALSNRFGDSRFRRWYRKFWEHAVRFYVEPATGTWKPELDAELQPSATVWEGRSDAYHSVGALVSPRVPLGGSLMGAVAEQFGRDGGQRAGT